MTPHDQIEAQRRAMRLYERTYINSRPVLGRMTGKAKLCGPEKALWEPKLSRWEKIFDWVEEKCNYVLAYLRAMG